jgi:hypothetical protein
MADLTEAYRTILEELHARQQKAYAEAARVQPEAFPPVTEGAPALNVYAITVEYRGGSFQSELNFELRPLSGGAAIARLNTTALSGGLGNASAQGVVMLAAPVESLIGKQLSAISRLGAISTGTWTGAATWIAGPTPQLDLFSTGVVSKA